MATRAFLGWHFNPQGLDPPQPTDYLAIVKFESTLRQPRRVQPNILDTLLRTADVGQGAGRPPGDRGPRTDRPGGTAARDPATLELAAGAVSRISDDRGVLVGPQEPLPRTIVVDAGATFDLQCVLSSPGRRPPISSSGWIDGRLVLAIAAYDQQLATRKETVRLVMGPGGNHTVIVESKNDRGISRWRRTDVVVRPDGTRRPPARSIVLVIAPTFPNPLPLINYAQEDGRDLKTFFERHLVSPEDGSPLDPISDVADPLDGPAATVQGVANAYGALDKVALGPGDLLVVVVESHVLNFDGRPWIAAADGRGIPPRPSIPADELARSLGEVVRRKCRVLVVVDGVHTKTSPQWDTDVNEWVRDLVNNQNVIAFVASTKGPGREVREKGHRAFALAILNSTRSRPPRWQSGPYSLNDFRAVVREEVLGLTGRQQYAECFIPEKLDGKFAIIEPQPARR